MSREDFSRIQPLIDRIRNLPQTETRALMEECLQSLLGLYGNGLRRIVEIAKKEQAVLQSFTEDNVVSGLLLIHDLHPIPLEARAEAALEKVRPYLKSHGGNVELVSLSDGLAKLRLQGSCDGCPSSASTMELAIRKALEESCPDLQGIVLDGVVDPSLHPVKQQHVEFHAPQWEYLESVELKNEDKYILRRGDLRIVICRADDKLYAYVDGCPLCKESFGNGTVQETQLRCPSGHAFDLYNVGASVEINNVHLQPIPLFAEDGKVRISLGAPNE